MSTLKRRDGEIEIDNRGSGDPIPGFGNMINARAPTLWCSHCGSCVVINPLRTRERCYCRQCDSYICDGCGAVTQKPGYMHRSIQQLSDMVMSGRFAIVGGSASDPILAPTGAVSSPSIILTGDTHG